jgi:hypothetical protein
MATKKRVWSWEDDYKMGLATKENSELFSLADYYEGQACPSMRTMECALMISSELNRRDASAEKMLQEAELA